MANKNPTMENASENLSLCLNPKKSQKEIYNDIQKEVIRGIFGE